MEAQKEGDVGTIEGNSDRKGLQGWSKDDQTKKGGLHLGGEGITNTPVKGAELHQGKEKSGRETDRGPYRREEEQKGVLISISDKTVTE